ncbi:hypothetical protein GvMRE_I2g128 [endosymbiont GvMRE of Glomus versiforme]|nr:hypothetical protein GvMRE_I2g128 [endosymbiont GvMRE of Glomus versiforme]
MINNNNTNKGLEKLKSHHNISTTLLHSLRNRTDFQICV